MNAKFVQFGQNYNILKMNPNLNTKPKRPPPLPSFGNSKIQQPNKDDEMQKKLDSFFTQISKETGSSIKKSQTPKIEQQKSMAQPEKAIQTGSIAANLQVVDNKKLSLASINSKLNSMLSTKKINLNLNQVPKQQPTSTKPVSLNPQVKQQKKRTQIPTEYDPNQPNSFDLSKHHYLDKFKDLEESSSEEDQDLYGGYPFNKKSDSSRIINKTGLEMMSALSQGDDQQGNIQAQEQQTSYFQTQQQPEEQALQEKQQVALRMMLKFGYKVGTGLGKQSQGITTPLTIKKTTDTSCIIQQSSIQLNQLIKPQISAKNALLAHNITITEVIVFVNLIKTAELTQEVEADLKLQCGNYGQVKNFLVFLLKGNPGKQEMRIFVQYDRKQQAFAAFCKLNNRYYGQNLASIRFYSKSEFESYKLGSSLHPHIET